WTDPAGNLIGSLAGRAKAHRAFPPAAIRLMAHMDEISMFVKKVGDDGALRVRPQGGSRMYNFGQGPVDILADRGVLPGVLSFGSMHATTESYGGRKDAAWMASWEQAFVFTGKTAAKLKQAGVHAGTRVVVAQSRRKLLDLGGYIAGFFFDDRAAMVVALAAIALLRKRHRQPATDVFLVMTSAEEGGCMGGSFSARTVPGEIALALDVGPAATEYGISLSGGPVVVYADASGLYDKAVADRLLALGQKLDLDPQCAAFENYGSDSSMAKRYGQAPLAGLLAIPTENTHGYEIIAKRGLKRCATLLAAYLDEPF
ncbi:MAG: M28 family peptidase, partial [Planctomycetota bacterium]